MKLKQTKTLKGTSLNGPSVRLFMFTCLTEHFLEDAILKGKVGVFQINSREKLLQNDCQGINKGLHSLDFYVSQETKE